MKYASTFLTVLIVAYWMLMTSLLVQRELDLSGMDQYRRGVNEFLGNALARERWMGIYRRHKKIGYSGQRVERVHTEGGLEYRIRLETLCSGRLPLSGLLSEQPGAAYRLEIEGDLLLDADLRPIQLGVDIELALLDGTALANKQRFFVGGERDGDRLRVRLLHGNDILVEVPLPLDDLLLSDGLTANVPLAGFRVGDSYRLKILDPLDIFGLGRETAVVHVRSLEEREVGGVLLDVYELETRFRGATSTSIVTPTGELVEQRLGPPLDLTLRREDSRESARRGFDR